MQANAKVGPYINAYIILETHVEQAKIKFATFSPIELYKFSKISEI